jgi:hypothetical protein
MDAINKRMLLSLAGVIAVSALIYFLFFDIRSIPKNNDCICEGIHLEGEVASARKPPREEQADNAVPSPKRSLYQLIKAEQIRFIRVTDSDYRMADYRPGEKLFLTGEESEILFYIETPGTTQITAEDAAMLAQQVKVKKTEDGRDVPFTAQGRLENESVTVTLTLNEVPPDDITVEFYAVEGEDVKRFPFAYQPEFGYAITSKDDPGIAESFKMKRNGVYVTHYVEPGKSYVYDYEFSEAVNRASVEDDFTDFLKDGKRQMDWIDDRHFRLTVRLHEYEVNKHVGSVSFYEVETKRGYTSTQFGHLQLYTATPGRLTAVDLSEGTKRNYFSTIKKYSTISVSSNGQWMLAAQEGSDELHSIYAYSIVDLRGNVLKQFAMDEISYPQWLAEDNSLLYVKGKDLIKYSVAEQRSQVVWSSPNPQRNETILSLTMDADREQIALKSGSHNSDGLFTYDLYLFKDIHDAEPVRIDEFGKFSCYEGPCPGPPMDFIDKDAIVHFDWEDAGDGSFKTIVYVLDLSTMKSRRVEAQGMDEGKLLQGDNMFLLSGGRFLQIEDGPSGTMRWSVVDLRRGQVDLIMETNFGNVRVTHLLAMTDGTYLLGLENKGWMILNLDEKTLQTVYAALPSDMTSFSLMGDTLYFFE